MKQILTKIKNGEILNSEEVQKLIYSDTHIDEVHLDSGRWTEHLQAIYEIKGRYYAVYWERGLTECQDNEFYSQVAEEVIPIDEVVTIRKWENVNE